MSRERALSGFYDTTVKLLTTRDLVEATLISTPPYIVLSCCEMFERYPAVVRSILEQTTAERIGVEARKPGGQLNQRWIWTMGTLFLWGREFLIALGDIDRGERLEDVDIVLSFVEAVSRSYRGDRCWVGVENDGGTVPALDRGLVERIEGDLVEACGERLGRLKRLNALLTTYTFLMGAESRKGMYAHGPYPVGNVLDADSWGFTSRRQMWIKEFSDLGVNRYSYSDVAADVDVGNLVIALVLEDVRAAVPPWGTHLMTEPADYLDRVTAYAVYEADRGLGRRLGDEDLDRLLEQVTAAQTRLYVRMAEWSRADALRAGTECYFKANIEPVARFAGVADRHDLELSRLTDRLLERITDEQAASMLSALTARPWHAVQTVERSV